MPELPASKDPFSSLRFPLAALAAGGRAKGDMDAFGAHSAKLGVSALLGPADPTTTDVRTVSPFSAP